jgi:hypothetical protein
MAPIRSRIPLGPASIALALLAGTFVPACGDDDDDASEHDAGRPDGGDHGGRDASTADGGGHAITDAGKHDAGDTPGTCQLSCDDAGAEEDDAGSAPDADFYPTADGASWVYRHGGATPWDEQVELTHTQYKGHAAFALSDSAGPSGTHGKAILVKKGAMIMRVHRDELEGGALKTTTDYDPGFVRYSEAWATAKIGSVETLGYTRVERDETGEITAEGSRSHTYTIKSRSASVSVPAGDFDGCLEVLRSRVRMPGQSAGEGDEDAFWFCPGVGKVREEDQATHETEELVRCDVPGGACP